MAEWTYEVIDKMSNPLQAIESQLNKLEHQTDRAGNSLDKLDQHQQKATHHGGLLGKMFSVEGLAALEFAKEAAELTHKVFELGEGFLEAAIEVREFKEESIATFEIMLNSKEAAEEEFNTLSTMAHKSSMTKQQVMGEYKELFSFTDRFGATATENVIAAAADIHRVLGEGASSAFVTVMRNIEALGGLNERSMRILRSTGVATPQRVYEALAHELHTTAKGAKALIKAGRVSQETSINTLLELVNTRIDKGKGLGALEVERSAVNVKDQIKNLHEAWEELFEGINIEPIAEALSHMTSMLHEGQPAGDKLREVLNRVFVDVTHVIDFATEHAEGFAKALSGLLRIGEGVLAIFEKMAPLAKAIGTVAGVVMDVGHIAVTGHSRAAAEDIEKDEASKEKAAQDEIARNKALADDLEAKLNQKLAANEQLESAMQKAGVNAGSGFMEGLASKIEAGEVNQLIQTQVTAAIDKALDAHSPSRVTAKRGRWAAEGMLIGWNDVMAGPRGFGAGFGIGGGVAPAAPPTPVFSGGGGGARQVNLQMSLKVEVGGPGAAQMSPQQVAEMSHSLEDAAERGVLRAFENLGVQN